MAERLRKRKLEHCVTVEIIYLAIKKMHKGPSLNLNIALLRKTNLLIFRATKG